jgi:hypothetical protein
MMGWFYRRVAERVLDLLVDHEEAEQAKGHDLAIAPQPWDDDRYTEREKALLRKRANDVAP